MAKSYNLTDIKKNGLSLTYFISKGYHDLYGYCKNEDFARREKLWVGHYERTKVIFQLYEYSFMTLPGMLSDFNADIQLPFGIRVPAEAQTWTDDRLGTFYWDFDKPSCDETIKATSHYQQLYIGYLNLHLRSDAKTDSLYHKSLISFTDAEGADNRRSFAYAIHQPIKVCGKTAYTTNVPDTVVVFLDDLDDGFKVTRSSTLKDELFTSAQAVSNAYFVHTALTQSQITEKLYMNDCNIEKQSTHNFIRILRNSDRHQDLQPFFPEGYIAVVMGAAAQ